MRPFYASFCIDCPHQYGTEAAPKLYPEVDWGYGAHVVGDKVRTADKIYPALSHKESEYASRNLFPQGRRPGAKLADGIIRVASCIDDCAEIEGLKRDVAGVVYLVQHLYSFAHDAMVKGIHAFNFAKNANLAVYKSKELLESRNGIFGRLSVFVAKGIGFKLRKRATLDGFVDAAYALQIVVVKHDDLAVHGDVNVDFDIEIVFYRFFVCRHTVFGILRVMQAAVSDRSVE